MDEVWLRIANVFFFVFHTLLIVFNIVGWAFAKTRRLHLYIISITLASWTLLGIWMGFGYCFLTDWHYDVLRRLGQTQLPHSYIVFLIESASGWKPPVRATEVATVAVTMTALMASVYVNFFGKTRQPHRSSHEDADDRTRG